MNDYLEQVEEQLVALTERGAHRRSRVPRDAVAIAGALGIVIAVIAVIATIGSSKPHPKPVTGSHGSHHVSHVKAHSRVHGVTKSTPAKARTVGQSGTTGPVPRGFTPESFSAISELTWWLVGPAACSTPCLSVVRTTDGGRSFVSIPSPPTKSVSQVAFADANDGFLYGPALFATHDGGLHWRQIELGGSVDDLAASGGSVYAVVRSQSGVGRLEQASVGSDVWTPSALPVSASGGLWVQGQDVLVESRQNALLASHDGGQTFTSYSLPPSVACQFQAPAPPVVWEHCATGMMSGTWRSTDGGRTFASAGGTHGWAGPELPNSAAFAAASATTAVVGFNQLFRTTDAGATWTKVSVPANVVQWQYVGFTDPTHGAAIALVGPASHATPALFYTTDGGASFHEVAIR